jgi:hypothetical protein
MIEQYKTLQTKEEEQRLKLLETVLRNQRLYNHY